MLNNSDYIAFLEGLQITSSSVKRPQSQHNISYTSSRYSPANSSFGQQQQEPLDASQLMEMADNEIFNLMKNCARSKQLQNLIQESSPVRRKLQAMLVDSTQNSSVLARLASDGNGNFVIQKLITADVSAAAPLIDAIEQMAPNLALNRFGCRVIQKLVQILPPDHIRLLLINHFNGFELQLINDQNGNHIIQYIITNYSPEIYIDFIHSLIETVGLKQAIENKYGCRVIQLVIEQTVNICKKHPRMAAHNSSRQKPMKTSDAKVREARTSPREQTQNIDQAGVAFDLLQMVLEPVLKDARYLAEQEFGNYIVQTILNNKFLHKERRHIIRCHLINNLTEMAQNKYASHVLEAAFRNAEDRDLDEMFQEILDKHRRDRSGKNALHYILFDEYGNYVMQRMLDIAFQVRLGHRKGNPAWFGKIVTFARRVERRLSIFSSGKKILKTINSMEIQLARPLFPPKRSFPLPSILAAHPPNLTCIYPLLTLTA